MPRQRHVSRDSVVSYGTGVKPPKPGVSRYGRPDVTSPPPALVCNWIRWLATIVWSRVSLFQPWRSDLDSQQKPSASPFTPALTLNGCQERGLCMNKGNRRDGLVKGENIHASFRYWCQQKNAGFVPAARRRKRRSQNPKTSMLSVR